MELMIQNKETNKIPVTVSSEVFEQPFNEALIHQVVTAYLTNGRAGTKAQKTRSEVSGGGIKPWRQKGTGRARAGSIRSPLWRHGGVTFAAKPRDFSQKINKKMLRGAMRSILSELIRAERLLVVEDLTIADHKTKTLLAHIESLNIKDVLIVSETIDENLYLASRNLIHVGLSDVQSLDPVSMIQFENVIMTLPALKKLEEKLS